MPNQPLAFAELLAGGVLTAAALTGASVKDVIGGKAGPLRGFTGGGASTSTPTGSFGSASTGGKGIYNKGNLGRVDQGVDFTGKGPVTALASGTIAHVQTGGSGWPGGTLVTYKLDSPVKIGDRVYAYIYAAENWTPSVNIGQHVNAGDVLGQAHGVSPFTETGFAADANGTTYARTHGGYVEGQQTQAGKDFLSWLGL